MALLLIPQFALPIQAFLAGEIGAGGIYTARLVVWVGFLYLVYLGFRLIRVMVLLYAIIVLALAMTNLIRAVGSAAILELLLAVLLIASMTAGLTLLLFDRAIMAFLTYQRGGKAPYPAMN